MFILLIIIIIQGFVMITSLFGLLTSKSIYTRKGQVMVKLFCVSLTLFIICGHVYVYLHDYKN